MAGDSLSPVGRTRLRRRDDRRRVEELTERLTLTPAGRELVQEVTRRRRAELVRMVDTMPQTWHEPVVAALRSLSAAAGEPPENEWWLGWATPEPDQAAS